MLRWLLTISMAVALVGCGEDKGGGSSGGGAGDQGQGAGDGDGDGGGDQGGADNVGGQGGDAGDQGGDPGDPGDDGDAGGDPGGAGDDGPPEGGEGEGEAGDEGGDLGDIPDAYERSFSGVLPADIEGVASVRVTVFDELGARSEAKEVQVEAQPSVGRGEMCDTVEALNVCADGDICFVAPIEGEEGEDEGEGEEGEDEGEGEEGEGEEGGEDVPGEEGEGEEGGDDGGDEGGEGEGEGEAGRPAACADFVVDFFAEAAQDAESGDWSVVGNNEDVGALLEGGCGGGNGQEVVYRFVAPEAGVWNISTIHEDTQFDTLLYARTACDDDSEEAELACNDDTGGLQSRIQVELEAQQEIWVVADAFSAIGVGDFVLTAYPMIQSAVGEPCDPDGSRRVCRPAPEEGEADNDFGDFCFITPPDPEDPESVATGECVASTPPNIANALAYVDDDFLALQLFGEDSSRDVVGLDLQLLEGDEVIVLNPDTGESTVDANFANQAEIYGETEFVGRIRFAGLAEFPQTDGVRVRLVDSQGLTSNTIDRPLTPIPTVAEGEVCDLAGIDNGCEGEGVCLPPEEEEGDEEDGGDEEAGVEGEGEEIPVPEAPPTEGVCVVPYVPILVDAQAFYSEETNALGLVFQVADEDEDVAGFSLDLLNADGFPIPLGPEREPGEFFDLRFPADPPEPGQCVEAQRECPDDFEILEIPEDADNDRWLAEGDTTGAASGAEGGGTCGGGGGGRHVYAFAPFEDGTYTFTTESDAPGADTVLYVRDLCGFSSPRAELGCNDDYRDDGSFVSQVSVDLTADETVWVFVDGYAGFGGGWEGAYRLIVTREL